MGTQLHLIVNPTSGRGRGITVAEQVSRLLKGRGIAHEIHLSRTPQEPTALALAAVESGPSYVVAIGGDGLVHQVASVLVRTEVKLGIIPAGTGNDFARALGVPFDIEKATHVLVDGVERYVDVGQANNRYFFSIAVLGLAAMINRRANQFKRLRVNALYSAVTVASVFLDRPQRFTLQYDGQTRQCYSWLIAIGNTWSNARGMALVPAARPDDGLLDLCIVNGMGKLELLYTFPRVFSGKHIYSTGIDTLRGREVTISAEQPSDLYGDGEYLGSLPVTFRVLPQALKIVLPPIPEHGKQKR